MDSRVGSACYPQGSFYPLSDDPSIRNRRITMSCFRICSTRQSCSQALLCHCTLWLISIQPERTFERLRYSLGGDRPSQTAHLTLSPGLLRRGLEFQYSKGSIPTTPPHTLACMILRLLPILYILHQNSISSYSKAPWGLSVLSRVTCIFTGTKISPSLSLRQCPNHYAFRAGRNLPDKEFRYLRTVIVTAAVYWGFNSYLRLR